MKRRSTRTYVALAAVIQSVWLIAMILTGRSGLLTIAPAVVLILLGISLARMNR